MREDIASILLSEEQIHTRVRELGAEISRDYAGKEPLFVGVLKGCFIFMADLFREVTIHGSVDFMAVSSYGNGTSTTGAVKINKDLSQDIENRDVIIVEDIVDTGRSIAHMYADLMRRNPASVEVCTLFFKPNSYREPLPIRYRALEIGNEFIVGYGLDYDQLGRNLKDIYVVTND